MHTAPTPSSASGPARWWTHGYLWLVLAGPLLVVLASLVTMYIAYTRTDPVVEENYYQKGLSLAPAPAAQGGHAPDAALAPASIRTQAPRP